MFGGVINLVSRMFGGSKGTSSVIDSMLNNLDKLNFSPQEKAAFKLNIAKLNIDWQVSSQGQNLSRRVLAFCLFGYWMFVSSGGSLMMIISIWTDNVVKSEKLVATADVLLSITVQTWTGVALILGFYFAAPHMREFVGPVFKKLIGGKNGDSK